MSNAYYELYKQKVYSLAKTLVIKSDAAAKAVNTGLEQMGYYVDRFDPKTWKYYLNLSGVYHQTDSLMTVTSMDTREEIAFTKENLRIHRATSREYAYGSRYYNELLRRYPNQESLIIGILNPVDIQTAINAEDGTILQYDHALVEDNEVSLIKRLETWIKGIIIRWNITDYAITDDLYVPAFLGVLYSQLPAKILNLRLNACHTNEVHSYHIREYLASNGKLENFLDFLTKKQALFLYRNIRYIHRNAGKAETFELLVKRILTERGIPLAAYEMRHNLSNQPDELYPDGDLIQVPLNDRRISAINKTRTVMEMLVKEDDVAKGNRAVRNESALDITTKMENSLNDRLQTKVLESDLVDLSDAAAFTLSDTLLNQWLWMSYAGLYPTILSVPHPVTGSRVLLTAKDAYAIFIYCYNKARGVNIDVIPTFIGNRVRREVLPSKAELKGIVNEDLVPDYVIEAALSDQPRVTRCISTESFYDLSVAIHKASLKHRELHCLQEHFQARGQVEGMVGRFYYDPVCKFYTDGKQYSDLLEEVGLDLTGAGPLELDIFALDILKTATGVNLSTSKSLRDLQAALLRLMEQLSSYSIQFIKSINGVTFRVADNIAIRLGDIDSANEDLIRVDNATIYVDDISAKFKERADVDGASGGIDLTSKERYKHKDGFDPTLHFEMEQSAAGYIRGLMPSVWFNIIDNVGSLTQLDTLVPTRMFEGLKYPNIDISEVVKDRIYDGLVYPWTPLSWLVTTKEYDGLKYPIEPLSSVVSGELDGFYYPFEPLTVPVKEFAGLTYPNYDLSGSIDVKEFEDLNYPSLDIVADGFEYPPMRIYVDGFEYPALFDSWIDYYGGDAFVDFGGYIDFGDNLDFIE